MESEPTRLALVVVGVCFVAFLLFKLFRPSRAMTAEWHEARRKVNEAKRRARDREADRGRRAAAWREAALAALEGLGRPSLAASYARRAERLDPDDDEAVRLLATSLRRASRYRALERFLWRRLAGGTDDGSAGYERAVAELLKLYEGPLRRPEMAKAIRRMRDRSG
jgi:hypothetical protein